jgi:hypothetical protein
VRFVSNNIEYKPSTSPCPLGVCNTFDAHNPKDPRYQNIYSVYSRLGRRNDGFPTGDY